MSVGRPDITQEKVLPLLEKGLTIPEIAEIMECGYNTLYVRAKKWGFEFSRTRGISKRCLSQDVLLLRNKTSPGEPIT